ncbi:uncharacterized protein SCHCODRAFT_02236062 [Schizophyllum commune H4-8]|uniref:uncharacterized protein n=1 Tax=Schizophyllum commune (strain H4-8 / FGSC 9210) TaxID=578458 RepID=UPI002160D8D9|nr:uncharacterized protein SCHCODRAFT_02236062 [Schizophyllum commune H4-8]KAI5895623.1 hypothetical protein SCHCODRAFT_02236062 [Schizophyllum commune H4-8]
MSLIRWGRMGGWRTRDGRRARRRRNETSEGSGNEGRRETHSASAYRLHATRAAFRRPLHRTSLQWLQPDRKLCHMRRPPRRSDTTDNIVEVPAYGLARLGTT